MSRSSVSKAFLILVLSSAAFMINACGKNQDGGESTTSASARDIFKPIGPTNVKDTKKQAGGTVTTFAEEDGSESMVWSDDNVANDMADGTQTIVDVCKGSNKTATDKQGRNWGYENDKSCIIL